MCLAAVATNALPGRRLIKDGPKQLVGGQFRDDGLEKRDLHTLALGEFGSCLSKPVSVMPGQPCTSYVLPQTVLDLFCFLLLLQGK